MAHRRCRFQVVLTREELGSTRGTRTGRHAVFTHRQGPTAKITNSLVEDSMNRKRTSILALVVLSVAALLVLASCDALQGFNPTLLGYPTVRVVDGSEYGHGMTHAIDVAIGDLPYTENFALRVDGGEGPVSVRSLNDVSDFDDPSFHQGKMVISHANSTGSFEITAGADYGFNITLDNTATAGSSYEIAVGIQNNDGIMPNPYVFYFRVTVL